MTGAAHYLLQVAVSAAALFAGGALYAGLVEHPARLATGPPMGVAHFRTSYPRGTRLQAPLASVGALAAGAAWAGGAGRAALAAGLLLGLAVAYTLAAMRPTDTRLMDPGLPPDSPEALRLLRRWGALHAVRVLLGLGALAVLPWGVR
jgi:hypothetical protein